MSCSQEPEITLYELGFRLSSQYFIVDEFGKFKDYWTTDVGFDELDLSETRWQVTSVMLIG